MAKEFEKFCEEMKVAFEKTKPEKMEVIFRNVTKQNHKELHGVILEVEGSAGAPTFYMEDLFPVYEQGSAADEIASALIEFAQENVLDAMPGGIVLEDYGQIRKNLGLMVLSQKKNIEYLKEMVYEAHEDLDLALIPIVFTNDHGRPGHLKVRKEFLEMWNVTEEEVIREAKENSPKILPAEAHQMCDPGSGEKPLDQAEMLVVTNPYCAGGAAAMFYPHVLEGIGQKLKRDYFVLPSSVNEFIVVPDEGQSPAWLHCIVNAVNETLEQEDVLSDLLYRYDRGTDKLSIAFEEYEE